MRNPFLGLAALALSLSFSPLALAQSLIVSPTAYNINPANSNTAQVRFENRSDDSVQFRVEVMQWTQVNGQNIYSPTRDVVANPTNFTLAPQQAQVVRVGVLKRVGSDELTYRVFLPPSATHRDCLYADHALTECRLRSTSSSSNLAARLRHTRCQHASPELHRQNRTERTQSGNHQYGQSASDTTPGFG